MKHLNNGLSVDMFTETPLDMIRKRVVQYHDEEDAFLVCDLGDIVQKLNIWKENLPRIEPFYAIKCNDDLRVVSLLAKLGIGFDCASKEEIQKVLSMKVSPSRIIYANPCKQRSHIKYATKQGVHLSTFDNEAELRKVKSLNPSANMVLRILPPYTDKVQGQLGNKYGCPVKDVRKLLSIAKALEINVIGVSFHVGTGCYDAQAYSAAVALSRVVFDMAKEMGFNFTLLDIGGGFPGQKSAKISFTEVCEELAPALDKHFPEETGVRIIAEPGRYFVASAFTIAVNIIAKRSVVRDRDDGQEITANEEPMFMYYLNDGLYGSFNCLIFDNREVTAYPLYPAKEDQAQFECSLWGPTCDGLDCITQKAWLPELDIGDWIVFHDMGAYTLTSASTFNGMPKPRIFYMSHDISHEVQRAQMCSKDQCCLT